MKMLTMKVLVFSALNTNSFSTIDECGFIEEHKIFEGSTDQQRLLDRSQFFEKLKVDMLFLKSFLKS